MKKVLIITYYWPPAGGPGVQRVVNIVERLPENGWEPIILTVENPSAPSKDTSLVKRIPDGCKIYRTRTREPFNAYKRLTGKNTNEALPKNVALNSDISLKEKLSRWIRANMFIPDARKGWKHFLVKEGLKIIENEKPDIIFSTSPPHSLQLGAKKLAKKSGLPWVCDLRDPWTEAYWESQMPKTAGSKKKNERLERETLNTADHITTVGKSIKDLLAEKSDKPVSVIYNGYRPHTAVPVKTNKFEILHLGNLSAMQYADTLYEAIRHLPPEDLTNIKVTFIGNVADEHKKKIMDIKIVETEFIGFLPYDEMIERAGTATLLFLPKLDSLYSKGLISAKLFDYLALLRPIAAITDVGSDIGAILDATENGRSFLPNEASEVSHYISNVMSVWRKQGHTMLKPTKSLERYSSSQNVKKLAEILEKTRKNS